MGKNFVFIVHLLCILAMILPIIDASSCEEIKYNETDKKAWTDMEKNLTVEVNDKNDQITINAVSNNIQKHLEVTDYLKNCTSGLFVNISLPQSSTFNVSFRDLGQKIEKSLRLDPCTNVSVRITAVFNRKNASFTNSPFVIRRSLLTKPNVQDLNVTVPTESITTFSAHLKVFGIDRKCESWTTAVMIECPATHHRMNKTYNQTIHIEQLCPGTTHKCNVSVQQHNSQWNQMSSTRLAIISTNEVNLSFTPHSRQIDVQVPAELSNYRYELKIQNSSLNQSNKFQLKGLHPNQEYLISLKVEGTVGGTVGGNSALCQYEKSWLIRTLEEKPEGSPTVLKQNVALEPFSITVHWNYDNVNLNVKVAVSNSLFTSDWSSSVVYLTAPSIQITEEHYFVRALRNGVNITLDLEPELYSGKINGTLFRKNEAYGIEKRFELDYDSFLNDEHFTLDHDIKPCFGYNICMNLTIDNQSNKTLCANTTTIPPNVPRSPNISIDQNENGQRTITIKTTDKGNCKPDFYEIQWTSIPSNSSDGKYCKNVQREQIPNVTYQSVETKRQLPNLIANSDIRFAVRGHNNHSWGDSSYLDYKTIPSLRDVNITVRPKPSENTIELLSFTICPNQGQLSETVLTCSLKNLSKKTSEEGECHNLKAKEEYHFCVTFKLQATSSSKKVCQFVHTICNAISAPKTVLTSVSPMEALTPFNPFLQARVKLPSNAFLNSTSVIELELVGATSESAIPLTFARDIVITTRPTLQPGETIELAVKALGCKNDETTNTVRTQTQTIEAALIQIEPRVVEIATGRCTVKVSESVANLCFLKSTTYQIGMNLFSMEDLFKANSSNSCVGPALRNRVNKTGINIEFNSTLAMLPIQIHYKYKSQTVLMYSDVIEFRLLTSPLRAVRILLALLFAMICAFVYWLVKYDGAQTLDKFFRRIKECYFNLQLSLPKHSNRSVEPTPLIQSAPSSPIAIKMFDQRIREPNFNLNVDYSNIQSWDVEVNIPKTSKSVGQGVPRSSLGTSLNRYSNIIPYNHSRVILKTPVDGKDYVNASWIRNHQGERRFIATQGPLPETRQAFWQMILDYKVSLIVMVTRLKEGGNVKCHQYWPGKHERQFGPIQVVSTKKSKREFHLKGLALDHLRVTKGDHTINVRHLQYQEWPDHGVPESPDSVLELRQAMNALMVSSDPLSPIVVHCSAGVGRTGTLIGLDNILNRIEEGATHIDVPRVVCQMREDRCLMVQQPVQYRFLVMAVAKYITSMPREHENSHENEEECEYDYIYHDDI
ncbi:uncharacterized protein LOC131884562 isoform X2 [Tigriopus californicus]|uniref:uncharacterized protein LOC131884562 isoform X2 n=1 Tax=Tigriopus californicus TaxID=6832 RepID=UPI0027DA4A1A|nr:uncharacterized protein LOC131884562 isoform X2 [Tigriopus californicus]